MRIILKGVFPSRTENWCEILYAMRSITTINNVDVSGVVTSPSVHI